VNLTPVSDTVYILGRSVAKRSRSGCCFGVGICVGRIFPRRGGAWAFVSIWLTSALASAVQMIGGVFGFSGHNPSRTPQAFEFAVQFTVEHNRGRHFAGRLTNILNPKVACLFSRSSPVHDPTSNANRSVLALVLHSSRPGTIGAYLSASLVLERGCARTNRSRKWINQTAGALYCFAPVSARHGEVTIGFAGDSCDPSIIFTARESNKAVAICPGRSGTESMTFPNPKVLSRTKLGRALKFFFSIPFFA